MSLIASHSSTPATARSGGRDLPYLVLDGSVVIAQLASADAAIDGAVTRLRQLIEQDAFGTVKVLDPAGRVLWRESASA